jgi:allantoinase
MRGRAGLVRSRRIALPHGITPGTVHVRDGKIAAIGPYSDRVAGGPEIDAGDMVVLPGLVDSHVHIDDPGRADWEGFDHATRAAAAGGVTTLVDMPLNCIPPTTTVEGLEAKRHAAAGCCHVDVAFWGGLVPGNRQQLEPLARAGARGFKCFLSPSGVDEFGHVTEKDLREALPIVASLGLPLLAHAEWPALLKDPGEGSADPRRYRTWLDSRPPSAELEAIETLLRLSAEFGARVHIVHLATPDALAAIVGARQEGLQVSVETCPHYLTFAAEEIADGATAFKCAPPIREGRQREGLWAALADGRIDFIATDHSPSPPALKRLAEGDFVGAWGGIASLQLGLAAVWTGMAARGLPLVHLSTWLAAGPAELAGLSGVKGSIAVGCDADLVIWDPDAEVVVDASTLYHRHPVTPYDGARLRGRVRTTMLRGRVIYDAGRIVAPGQGRTM